MNSTRTLALCLALAGAPALAADWPQWRGPDRTGISTEKGLLKAWPKGGPTLVWTAAELGGGYATPAVAGGRVFVTGSEKGEEFLHALSEKDGKPLWSLNLGKVGENKGPQYPGARSTPTVDGDRLYALGSDGDLVCATCDKGRVIWRKHLEKDFGGARGEWAYCESVLIDGDALICTPGGPKAAMVALNKKDGRALWKMPMESANRAGYASAVIARAGPVKLYVQFMAAHLVGVDARSGKLLWKYRKNVGGVSANAPIVHDGHVFTTASGNSGAGGDALLKLIEKDGEVSVKQVYLKSGLKAFHGGAVRVGDHVYGTGGEGLVCLELMTGEVKWRHRSIGAGAVMVADGMLYLRSPRGQVALVKVTTDGYQEMGRLSQPKRSEYQAFAHPVVANGRLYLRDGGLLFCYDVKAR